MHAIYELKEKLCDELEEYGQKSKLDVGALDIVDKLAHTIKNLDKIIENYEENGYSERDGYMYDNMYDRGSSYARRGMPRRDAMGRYSRDSKSMVQDLKKLMDDAPDEKTRMEFQRFIDKMERM